MILVIVYLVLFFVCIALTVSTVRLAIDTCPGRWATLRFALGIGFAFVCGAMAVTMFALFVRHLVRICP